MKKALSYLLLILAFNVIVSAQDLGSVYGRVETIEKAALRETLVKLESDSLFAGFLVIETDQKGQFRFNNLPGGNYKLTLEKEGYKNLSLPAFSLNHGASRKLNLIMVSDHLTNVVALSQEAGEIDTTESSNSYYFSYPQITRYSNLRSLTQLLPRIPGFTDFSGYGSVQEAGLTVKIDGVPVMDPGKGLLAAQLSQNAIDGISVDMFDSPVSQSNSMGPTINLITKRGGNSFHGEISAFMQSAEWASDNTGAYNEEGLTMPVASSFINPAFSLGGPISDERLWFFVSGNLYKRNTDRQLMDKVIDVERISKQYNLSLTSQISEKQNAGFSLFSNTDDISHQPWRDIWGDNYEESLHKKDVFFDLYIFNHNINIKDDLQIASRFSLFNNGLTLKPVTEGDIKYDQASGQFLEGTKNSHYRSEEGSRQDFKLNLNYFNDSFFGRHNFNTGVEYERSAYERINDQQALGLYWNGEKYKLFDFGRLEAKSRIRRFSLYFDDSWSLTPRFTLNLGIRSDSTNHTSSYPESSPSGTEDFILYNDLSYQLGFAYDAFGNGRTIVKGSVGRYFKTPLVGNTEPLFSYFPDTKLYYGSSILGPAIGDQWILWNQYNNRLPLRVDEDLVNEYSEGFYLGVDQKIGDEFTSSVDLVWKKDHNIIGITYPETTFAHSSVDYQGQNGSYQGIYYNVLSKGSYALYTNPKEGDPGIFTPVYRKYYAVTATISRILKDNYSFSASYTYSRNEGTVDNSTADILYGQDYFGNPNYYINRDGRLGLERPHSLKITGFLMLPLDFTVSSYFRFLSGTPYAPEVTFGASTFLASSNDGSRRMSSQFLWDIRIQKEILLLDRYRLTFISDIFNILNDDALTSYISTNIDSDNYLKPGEIVNGRFFQLGLRLSF